MDESRGLKPCMRSVVILFHSEISSPPKTPPTFAGVPDMVVICFTPRSPHPLLLTSSVRVCYPLQPDTLDFIEWLTTQPASV